MLVLLEKTASELNIESSGLRMKVEQQRKKVLGFLDFHGSLLE